MRLLLDTNVLIAAVVARNLVLGHYRRIPILTPRQFLEWLDGGSAER
jgi:predicted nucleic acid-binding protein